METCFSLKENCFGHWEKLLECNFETKNCQVVGKNGRGFSYSLILAAASPRLKELLQDIPPYIDGCVILPDFDWKDISQLLESLARPGQTFRVSNDLLAILGINHLDDSVKVAKEEVLEEDIGLDIAASIGTLSNLYEVVPDVEVSMVSTNVKQNNEGSNSKIVYEDFKKKVTLSNKLGSNKDIKKEGSGLKVSESNTGVDNFKCELCHRYFDTEAGLAGHNTKVHGESEDNPNYQHINGIFKCLLCDKEVSKRSRIRSHLKARHKLGANFKCEFCNKLFSFKYNLNTHRRSHTQEKCYFCDECGEGFLYSSKLYTHKRTVHLSKEEKDSLKKHTCQLCGSSFVFKCKLKVHMECHNQVKTFNCEYCGKVYRTSKGLGAHHRTTHKDNKKKIKTDEQLAVQAARARRYRAIKSGKIGPDQFLPGDEQFAFSTYTPRSLLVEKCPINENLS